MSCYNTLFYITQLFSLNISKKIHYSSVFALVLCFEEGKGIKAIQAVIRSHSVAHLCIIRPTSSSIVTQSEEELSENMSHLFH